MNEVCACGFVRLGSVRATDCRTLQAVDLWWIVFWLSYLKLLT